MLARMELEMSSKDKQLESTMITEAKLRYGLTDFQLSELLHCAWGTIGSVEAGRAHLNDISRERLEHLLSEEKGDKPKKT